MRTQKNSHSISLINIYHLTTQAIISEAKIWGPFFIMLTFQLIALTLIYLAPRTPFVELLGPPIKKFFGEIYLHYPAHLLIIPTLTAKTQNLITVLAGPLFIGTAVAMAGLIYRNKRVSFWGSFKTAFLRYIQILFIFIIIFYLAYFFTNQIRIFLKDYFASGNESLLIFDEAWWRGPFLAVSYFVIFLVTQAFLIYSIPMILIDNVKLFTAIVKSISLFLQFTFKTIFLIALPMCFYIPVMVLLFHTPIIINKFYPDAIFGICVAGSILNWLLIDLLIHVSTTFAYLEATQPQKA